MNIVDNLLDRYAGTATDRCMAVRFEDEAGSVQKLTYAELRAAVNRAANGLRSLGLGPGDVIGVCMPMVPEIVVAMLAILKIGAIFLPLFSGYGAQAIASRCWRILMASGVARSLVSALESAPSMSIPQERFSNTN